MFLIIDAARLYLVFQQYQLLSHNFIFPVFMLFCLPALICTDGIRCALKSRLTAPVITGRKSFPTFCGPTMRTAASGDVTDRPSDFYIIGISEQSTRVLQNSVFRNGKEWNYAYTTIKCAWLLPPSFKIYQADIPSETWMRKRWIKTNTGLIPASQLPCMERLLLCTWKLVRQRSFTTAPSPRSRAAAE